MRSELLLRWRALHLLGEMGARAVGARHRFDHMNRKTNAAALLGDRAHDGLTNPVGGVGRELVAFAIVEFFNGANEPHAAFLNEVSKCERGSGEAAAFPRDISHKAKV